MDFLSAFDILDDDDEVRSSRDARIDRAFERSKESYKTELVLTPPGWFNSTLTVAERLQTSSRSFREVEWSVQQLYLQRRFSECLAMCLDFLDAIESTGGHEPGEGKQELRRRETLDVGMRCAIQLEDKQAANDLADRSRPSWRTTPGLASTAGDAYVCGDSPVDALTPLLCAVSVRGPLYPFVRSISEAFRRLAESTPSKVDHRQNSSAQWFSDVLTGYAERLSPAFRAPLFKDGDQASVRQPHPREIPKPSEHDVRRNAERLHLKPEDISRLVTLCCNQTQAEDEADEPRSVRTL